MDTRKRQGKMLYMPLTGLAGATGYEGTGAGAGLGSFRRISVNDFAVVPGALGRIGGGLPAVGAGPGAGAALQHENVASEP